MKNVIVLVFSIIYFLTLSACEDSSKKIRVDGAGDTDGTNNKVSVSRADNLRIAIYSLDQYGKNENKVKTKIYAKLWPVI